MGDLNTYLVWCPNRGETERHAEAFSYALPEYAVEEWAERDDADSADYRIASGTTLEVCVRADDGSLTRWRVSGRMVPEYDAEEVTRGK